MGWKFKGEPGLRAHPDNKEKTVKIYKVYKNSTAGSIERDGTSSPLNPRHDLRNHSPDGFSYGYHGSGCAQLALAILADALADATRAQKLYQDFKRAVVARAPQEEDFEISEEAVLGWVKAHEQVAE